MVHEDDERRSIKKEKGLFCIRIIPPGYGASLRAIPFVISLLLEKLLLAILALHVFACADDSWHRAILAHICYRLAQYLRLNTIRGYPLLLCYLIVLERIFNAQPYRMSDFASPHVLSPLQMVL
jgi:hypothetical protein